jgi:hypothetical protein
VRKNFIYYLEGRGKSFYICTLILRNAEINGWGEKSGVETKISLEN